MSVNIEQLLNNADWLQNIDTNNFDETAFSIFRYQYHNNNIYKAYVDALRINPHAVVKLQEIPFLPISFFKSHSVLTATTTDECNLIFESSGTTTTINSKHYVKNPALYRQSFLQTFQRFYHNPESYVFLCLLPSYLERKNSSLVYMAEELIQLSGQAESGFYLNEWKELAQVLQSVKNKKIILLGVTFALLDFAAEYPMNISKVTVMETGGMKGRREEWTREQVHCYLKQQWNLPAVHSEYGMTELLSQAYAKQDGIFESPPFLKMLVRDENDPFDIKIHGNGCLNIIDLANIDSCSFIATDDIGKIAIDNTFQVLGRADNSALRGCSLMVI